MSKPKKEKVFVKCYVSFYTLDGEWTCTISHDKEIDVGGSDWYQLKIPVPDRLIPEVIVPDISENPEFDPNAKPIGLGIKPDKKEK